MQASLISTLGENLKKSPFLGSEPLTSQSTVTVPLSQLNLGILWSLSLLSSLTHTYPFIHYPCLSHLFLTLTSLSNTHTPTYYIRMVFTRVTWCVVRGCSVAITTALSHATEVTASSAGSTVSHLTIT